MAATKRKNMNPRIERKITRISGVREVKQTFLIICEGVNTEPDYFNAFRLTSATVKAIGQGMGTLALVQKAINIKEQERQRGRTYNQNWVVFEKMIFQKMTLTPQSCQLARMVLKWLIATRLLNFGSCFTSICIRGLCIVPDMKKMLSTLLGFAYTKKSGVSSKMFNALFLKQEQAINHAKTIMKQFDGNNPAQQESSTTVYRLVEELNNFL